MIFILNPVSSFHVFTEQASQDFAGVRTSKATSVMDFSRPLPGGGGRLNFPGKKDLCAIQATSLSSLLWEVA